MYTPADPTPFDSGDTREPDEPTPSWPTQTVRLGVRELRSSIAAVVQRAAAGERTVITAHGRPVAQLGPLDGHAPDLDRLVTTGAVIPPRRVDGWRPVDPVEIWSGVRIDQALRELRG